METMGWVDTGKLGGQAWTCGHCGCTAGGNEGYHKAVGRGEDNMYICPKCGNPTIFIREKHGIIVEQIPAPSREGDVLGLPTSVKDLWKEMCLCESANAHTAAVLCARKLLMHIAVDNGASEDLPFAAYVNWLADNGYIPPGGSAWVDDIRKTGNEANHEIEIMRKSDSKRLLDFCEMLLRFVYEFPARVARS